MRLYSQHLETFKTGDVDQDRTLFAVARDCVNRDSLKVNAVFLVQLRASPGEFAECPRLAQWIQSAGIYVHRRPRAAVAMRHHKAPMQSSVIGSGKRWSRSFRKPSQGSGRGLVNMAFFKPAAN